MYKDGIINRLYKGLQGLVKSRKIQLVEGEGKFVGRTPSSSAATGTSARTSSWPPAPSPAPCGPDHRGPGHHLDPGAEPGVGPRDRDRAGRRRHRRRVRLHLGLLRHQRHHRRGPAHPGPAGGPRGRPSWSSARSASARSTSRTGVRFKSVTRTTPESPSCSRDGTELKADLLLVAVGAARTRRVRVTRKPGITMDRGFVINRRAPAHQPAARLRRRRHRTPACSWPTAGSSRAFSWPRRSPA